MWSSFAVRRGFTVPRLKNSSLLVFSFRLKLSPPPAGVACCVCRLLFSSMSMAKRMAKPPVATAWPQRHGRIQWGLGGLEKGAARPRNVYCRYFGGTVDQPSLAYLMRTEMRQKCIMWVRFWPNKCFCFSFPFVPYLFFFSSLSLSLSVCTSCRLCACVKSFGSFLRYKTCSITAAT